MQKRLILALLLISILLIPTLAFAEDNEVSTYILYFNALCNDTVIPTDELCSFVCVVTTTHYIELPDVVNLADYDEFVSVVQALSDYNLPVINTAHIQLYRFAPDFTDYDNVDRLTYCNLIYYDNTTHLVSFYDTESGETVVTIPNWNNLTNNSNFYCHILDGFYGSYQAGITYADSRVSTGSASYQAGYNYANTQVINNSASYRAGYTAGATSSTDYSFRSLISACFDVPVNTFVSFFNFDTEGSPIGVNFLPLVTTLLTLSLVIAIAKMFVK